MCCEFKEALLNTHKSQTNKGFSRPKKVWPFVFLGGKKRGR